MGDMQRSFHFHHLLGGGLGPDDLQTTGHLVRTVAISNLVVPAKTHLANVSSFGLRANVVCGISIVSRC